MRWNEASCCDFIGKSIETETTTWLEFSNGGKAIVEQIPVSEEINKSKRAGLWESHSVTQVGQLTISVRSLVYRFHQKWTLNFPNTNTLADGLIERISTMLDGIGSKTGHNDEEGDR